MAGKTASLGDRFAAADPGLLRLTAGLRAVLGLTLALAALTALDQPPLALLVGGFATVTTALAISDPHPRGQLLTLLAGAPVTLAALAAGGLLAPFPLASRLAFLLLIFIAVAARRFGRRGLGLGIFAFMAYFLSQFADIQAHQLPQLTGAVGVAFAAAAVSRLCLAPTTSHGTLKRLKAAFTRRLRDARQAASNLPADGTGNVRRLQRRLDRLHTAALLLQEFLYEAPAGLLCDTTTELERTARANAAAQRLGAGVIRASKDAPASAAHRARAKEAEPPDLGGLRELGDAGDLRRLTDRSERSERGRTVLRPAMPHPARPLRPATRQAFQATAAAALAVLGGTLLSPDLWYWAVATAWVVFINAEHTADILLQSGRRLIGTVVGVPFGYGLAVLASGDIPVALAFLLVCVFGMFSTPAGSYWAVTFFITGSLSMVLALLHTLSAELLVLRVQETALGAGCGILAAALVVPTRVRTVAETRLADLLAILDHLAPCAPPAGPPERAPEARELDQALEAFRKACRPLVHPLNPRRAERARVRRVLDEVQATAVSRTMTRAPEPAVTASTAGPSRPGAFRAALPP